MSWPEAYSRATRHLPLVFSACFVEFCAFGESWIGKFECEVSL